MTATAPARRQEERSRSTRQRVLEAAVECLVELGWSGTTTTVVAERAGVSRGAQLHHYRTKSALVVAAVEHLAERRAAELRAEAAALSPGGDRVARTVDLLASLVHRSAVRRRDRGVGGRPQRPGAAGHAGPAGGPASAGRCTG